jgi:hypothetical protein
VTALASLGDTTLGALIAGGFGIAGALIALYGVRLTNKIPAEVAEFATQLAGALDGVRQAIAASRRRGLVEAGRKPEDASELARNVTVYLSETERLLGGARLHLNRGGERRADAAILELRVAEDALRGATASVADVDAGIDAAEAAYERALNAQRRFARAVRSPLISRLVG